MITTTQQLVDSMQTEGLACAQDTVVVTPKEQDIPLDFCICAYECDYIELAFSSDDGDAYKNDSTSILINMIDLSGTFEFFLFDGITQTPLIDDTHGQFFGFGSLAQINKVGYIIDWKKVFDTLGGGKYRIQVDVTEFGSTVSQESHTYKATVFSEENANGTVRIQTINSGVILNGVDYAGLEWPRSVRMPGRFGNEQPQLTKIDTLDSQRKLIQVQQSIRDQFTLETGLIPSNVYDFLKNDMNSSVIFADSYNLFGFREFKQKQILLSDFEEVQTDYAKSTRGRVKLLVNDINLELKRNI